MKYEYKRETVHGTPEEVLKTLNSLGSEGWQVVHAQHVDVESHNLSPATILWLMRSNG